MGRARRIVGQVGLVALFACKPRSAAEAEAKHDIAWLVNAPAGESTAALGRLADTDPDALAALERRPPSDVSTYIAAWTAVTRDASWGTAFLHAALTDPTRADVAATALPRRDPRLVPFVADLEGAVARLAAGHRGTVLAGVLASVGPAAHAAVERRLVDATTRGAMCDGIGLPEATGDAKSLVLAVAPEARDHASCLATILGMAANEDPVLDWLGVSAEPGLLTATARSPLACARIGTLWRRGLTERPPETHAALAVPLQISIRRCTAVLDPILAELVEKAPRSRACIAQAVDPYSGELAEMKMTCRAFAKGLLKGEPARIRERAADAVAHGCALAR